MWGPRLGHPYLSSMEAPVPFEAFWASWGGYMGVFRWFRCMYMSIYAFIFQFYMHLYVNICILCIYCVWIVYVDISF